MNSKVIFCTIGSGFGWFVGEFHPTFPLIIVAVAFILYDAWTAFQLDKRVHEAYPEKTQRHKVKFTSFAFGKVIRSTIPRRLSLIILAFLAEHWVFIHVEIPLSYIVTGAICFEQGLSILENESSCREESESRFWWLPLPILQNTTLIAVNQPLANSCLVTQNQRGTKTGQNHGKIKSRTLRSKYPLWNISVSFAKVQICPLKNEGKSLFLSFTTHFPTIVPQIWLLQTVLTSSSMTCEYRVLNIVFHSDGHFQKRELAIEPKICHPYCPILGFGNV